MLLGLSGTSESLLSEHEVVNLSHGLRHMVGIVRGTVGVADETTIGVVQPARWTGNLPLFT